MNLTDKNVGGVWGCEEGERQRLEGDGVKGDGR